MKATEKEILYNLIKTASQHINGYTLETFTNPPNFTDDVIPTNNDANSFQENESGLLSDIGETAAPQSAATTVKQIPSQISNTGDLFIDSSSSGSEETSAQSNVPSLTLQDIERKIAGCMRCVLAKTRTNTVPGIGVQNPEVMIVGEGPGADEDAKGEPFVGRAGQLLDKMLTAIKLDRHKNCYIANIVKCRPPKNRDPLPDEAAACIGFLEAQIKLLNPKMILCVGKVAAHNLLKNNLSISAMRGTWYNYNGIPVLVTYHPSALLRDNTYKAPAWEDLKMFARRLKEMSIEYNNLFG